MNPNLGDHAEILMAVSSESSLKLAFAYAIHHRQRSDFFYDPFELDFVRQHEAEILRDLHMELTGVGEFRTRPAFAYFTPKNDRCFRRMIYLPFKDLVARYAFISVIGDCTNGGLYPYSFANRRASGAEASTMLLESFATTSWPKFCAWQREQLKTYSILLKTDISAFYDSISHEYLIEAIASTLGLPRHGALFQRLFGLLRTDVISYSKDSTRTTLTQEIRQGLCIGNAGDGYLANLYLDETDTIMQRYCIAKGLAYARYNDDIRIFANDKSAAKDACLLLQQCLLAKGLNLNSSKTEIAKDKKEMEDMISKGDPSLDYLDGADYDEDYDDKKNIASRSLHKVIDHPFEFDDGYSIHLPLESDAHAKKFCKFLHKHLNLSDRQSTHVEELGRILLDYPASTRYACWLLAQSSAELKCSRNVRKAAARQILSSLRNPDVSTYGKYRILHHLTKWRVGGYRFLNRLDSFVTAQLDHISTNLLSEPAIDLIIGAMYYKFVRGTSRSGMESLLHAHVPKPIAIPLQNIVLRMDSEPGGSLASPVGFWAASTEEDDPDAVHEYY